MRARVDLVPKEEPVFTSVNLGTLLITEPLSIAEPLQVRARMDLVPEEDRPLLPCNRQHHDDDHVQLLQPIQVCAKVSQGAAPDAQMVRNERAAVS